MKTIEIGMYVRTKKGIAKVTKIDDLDNVAWTDKKDIYFGVNRETGYLDWYIYDDGTVIKTSHNIIDLIEIGDYVNGFKIVKIFINEFNNNKMLIALQRDDDYEYSNDLNDYMCDESIHIYNEDIKTILTKEQFENNCYKIGD